MNIATIIRAEKLCFVDNIWYKLYGNKNVIMVMVWVNFLHLLNCYFIDWGVKGSNLCVRSWLEIWRRILSGPSQINMDPSGA